MAGLKPMLVTEKWVEFDKNRLFFDEKCAKKFRQKNLVGFENGGI
ncbi:MAG TPA: hypothetical protein PLP24_08745 [Acetivibrio thermocellus]|jgi:hypothetical protein|nr:hypothetical protein [Acetivibrio thermocellus]HOP93442.1 hypothetical protein [Acetivibrio thermocellus]